MMLEKKTKLSTKDPFPLFRSTAPCPLQQQHRKSYLRICWWENPSSQALWAHVQCGVKLGRLIHPWLLETPTSPTMIHSYRGTRKRRNVGDMLTPWVLATDM